MELWQSSIWQGATGRWYCNNVSNLGKGSGVWYLPARVLGITPVEFIEFLLKEYKPDYCYYSEENNFLSYSWAEENKALCNSFKLYINRKARENNFQI